MRVALEKCGIEYCINEEHSDYSASLYAVRLYQYLSATTNNFDIKNYEKSQPIKLIVNTAVLKNNLDTSNNIFKEK